MDSALIVSSTEKSISYLTDILRQAAFLKISHVKTAGEARRLLIQQEFDLCMINGPLPDEFGESLAQTVAAKGFTEIIFFVKAELFEEISHKVEDYGVIAVSKPINRAMLWSALKVAQAVHKRLRTVQNENRRLLQRIEDLRVIDRAKCVLIASLAMTEPEAHKYIEKQAMDMRITRKTVAEKILRTYET
jgi:response regulator NasT